MPVAEAFVNSLHAVRDLATRTGAIKIEILRARSRGSQQKFFEAEDDIVGVRIVDNGVGFDRDNFVSFTTSDSTYKASVGGRGIGRFSWLKVFETADVDSVYANGMERRRRRFRFSIDGISDLTDVAAPSASMETRIELRGLRETYQRSFPKKAATLGHKISDHCLIAILGSETRLVATITDGDDSFDVGQAARALLEGAKQDVVEIGGERFELTHIRRAASDASGHQLSFLANKREVFHEPLARGIAALKQKLSDEAGSFWWLTLIESPILDRTVTAERDDFSLPKEIGDLFAETTTAIATIRSEVTKTTLQHLAPFLEPVYSAAEARVSDFVYAHGPEYRLLLTSCREELRQLAPDLSNVELEIELFRIRQQLESRHRERGKALLETGDAAALEKYIEEENGLGKSNLARYIVHRRNVLDLLNRKLEAGVDGRPEFETAVHRVIFPLGKTSDEVTYEEANLWVVDERLAYHRYLASDKKLKAYEGLRSDSKKEPDIVIFDSPFAFTDEEAGSCNAVTVIEFKRPGRDDYGDGPKKNPVDQVYDYIELIRGGSAKDNKGRQLAGTERTVFYAYIIADLTPSLRSVVRYRGFEHTPDRQGMFCVAKEYNAFVEIIPYAKLIGDSIRRNKVLFDKLFIPLVRR